MAIVFLIFINFPHLEEFKHPQCGLDGVVAKTVEGSPEFFKPMRVWLGVNPCLDASSCGQNRLMKDPSKKMSLNLH